MALGKVNWAALSNYKVTPSNMELFQTYMTDARAEVTAGNRGTGILYGGKISYIAGLTVRVSAGAAIMPNGLLVNFSQTDITLATADLTNPRLDRIQLTATITQNTTVVDEANISKTLDFTYITVPAATSGTPAATPSMVAADPTKLSVGYVQVPATAIALTMNNVFQNPDLGYDKSSFVMGNNTGFLRYNDFNGQFELSPNNITWRQLNTSPYINKTVTILNNQVALADIAGMTLDTSQGFAYQLKVQITRETASVKERCYGDLIAIYNPTSLVWDLYPNLVGDDCGVAFSSVLVSGTVSKVQYTSDTVSGTSYAGTIKFSARDIL